MFYHKRACGTDYRGCAPECLFQWYHSDEQEARRNNMKQVSYDFDWLTLAGALVVYNRVEDGYWQINLRTESVTSSFPAPVEGAVKMVLPGHLIRITGIQLQKVPNLGFMCVKVENGLITDVNTTADTNQRTTTESGGAVGEDSKYPREVFMSPIAAGFS